MVFFFTILHNNKKKLNIILFGTQKIQNIYILYYGLQVLVTELGDKIEECFAVQDKEGEEGEEAVEEARTEPRATPRRRPAPRRNRRRSSSSADEVMKNTIRSTSRITTLTELLLGAYT